MKGARGTKLRPTRDCTETSAQNCGQLLQLSDIVCSGSKHRGSSVSSWFSGTRASPTRPSCSCQLRMVEASTTRNAPRKRPQSRPQLASTHRRSGSEVRRRSAPTCTRGLFVPILRDHRRCRPAEVAVHTNDHPPGILISPQQEGPLRAPTECNKSLSSNVTLGPLPLWVKWALCPGTWRRLWLGKRCSGTSHPFRGLVRHVGLHALCRHTGLRGDLHSAVKSPSCDLRRHTAHRGLCQGSYVVDVDLAKAGGACESPREQQAKR